MSGNVDRRTVVDVLEEHFGEKLTKNMADRLSNQTTPRIDDLLNGYIRLTEDEQSFEKPESELRPFAYSLQSTDNRLTVGPEAPSLLSPSGFRSLLLYAHSVAFEDPLSRALWREATDSSVPSYVSVAATVESYSWNRDLIQSHALVPMPTHPFGRKGRNSPALAQLDALDEALEESVNHSYDPSRRRSSSIRSLASTPYEELTVDQRRELDLDKLVWKWEVESDLRSALFGATRHSPRVDIWLPKVKHVAALEQFVKLTGQRSGIWETGQYRTSQLLSVNLPYIPDLDDATLIAMRKSEDAFENWRSALAYALDKRASVERQGWGDSEVEFRQSLAEAAARIANDWRLIKIFGSPLRSLGMGIFGVFLSGSVFGWDQVLPAVLGGAGTAAADVLAETALKRRERSAGKAIGKTYCLVMRAS